VALKNRDKVVQTLHELNSKVALPICRHFGLRYNFFSEHHPQAKKAGVTCKEPLILRKQGPDGTEIQETRYLVTIRLRLRLHPTKGDPQSDFLSHGTQIAVLLHELCHLKHMNHGKDFMLFLRDIFAFAQKLGVFEAGESNEIPSPWPWENVIFQRAGNVSDDELLQLFAEHREKQRQAKTPEEALKAAEVEAAELEAVSTSASDEPSGVTYFLRFLAVSDVSVGRSQGEGSILHDFTDQALEAYFDGLHRGDVERMKEVWHPEARLYWADAAREGGVADRSAEQFFEYMRSSTNSEDLSAYDQILSLDFASSRCCAAQVQLALKQSDPASGALLFTDFLVLLRLNKKWQIISKVFSSVPLSEQSYQEPYDALAYAVSDPVRGILSYMRGVHQSSPSLVSESFHGAARLCFSDQQEELVRWSRAEFFEVLQARAKSLDDPQALRFDKILSVRKAGPDVALIKLQVGLPPVLYTDFLSMLRLNGRWWIIAKSSDGAPERPKLALVAAFNGGHRNCPESCDGCENGAGEPTEIAYGEETDPASTWISKRADEGEPFAGPHLPPLARSPRPPLPGPTKKLPEKLPPIGARWGMG
ncbi:unnamed protein product, partial [Durusdinium trenchii]